MIYPFNKSEEDEQQLRIILMLLLKRKRGTSGDIINPKYAPEGYEIFQRWYYIATGTTEISAPLDVYYNIAKDNYFFTTKINPKITPTSIVFKNDGTMLTQGQILEKVYDYYENDKTEHTAEGVRLFLDIYDIFDEFAQNNLPSNYKTDCFVFNRYRTVSTRYCDVWCNHELGLQYWTTYHSYFAHETGITLRTGNIGRYYSELTELFLSGEYDLHYHNCEDADDTFKAVLKLYAEYEPE